MNYTTYSGAGAAATAVMKMVIVERITWNRIFGYGKVGNSLIWQLIDESGEFKNICPLFIPRQGCGLRSGAQINV